MMKALYEIGKSTAVHGSESSGGLTPEIEMLLDTRDLIKSPHLIEILIKDNSYQGVRYRELDVENDPKTANQLLYKRGPANGADFTLTSKLSWDIKTKAYSIDKAMKKIGNFFNNPGKVTDEEKEWISGIKEIFNTNLSQIKTEIVEHIAEYKVADAKEKGVVISFNIENNNLAAFSFFKDRIKKEFLEKARTVKNKPSKAEHKVCCLSHDNDVEVLGNAGNFNFLTWDKWSFIAGGFEFKSCWRNYPVSADAYLWAEFGKRVIQDEMRFRFCNFFFLLIPYQLIGKEADYPSIIETMGKTKRDNTLGLGKKGTISRLSDEEDIVFEDIAAQDDSLSFHLFFFDENPSTKAIRILLSVEFVQPSLIRRLFDAQYRVKQIPVFIQVASTLRSFSKTDDQYEPWEPNFTFYTVRSFFYNSKAKGNFDKQFLELTGKIFSLKPISYVFLIKRFNEEIQYQFRNGKDMIYAVTRAFLILHFLEELNILKDNIGGPMTYYDSNEVEQEFFSFFTSHQIFYNKPERVASFLIGVYVRKLLNIQRQLRNGSMPFAKRLNGLKLTEDILKRIYWEAMNKYMEYDKAYYMKLESLISKYLSDSNFDRISSNDLSFYFATGMSMASLFLKKEEQVTHDEETNE